MATKYTVRTTTGTEIDVTEWVDQIRENIRLKRGLTERTSFGQREHGKYFWWDEEKNPLLNGHTVAWLFRKLKAKPRRKK